jgi:hypothetical protein
MDTHEGKPAMNSSGNTSMIITAFAFMVLMLIITAPAAGPAAAPDMDHCPGPVPDNITTAPVAGLPPLPPMAGSGLAPDAVMARVLTIANL